VKEERDESSRSTIESGVIQQHDTAKDIDNGKNKKWDKYTLPTSYHDMLLGCW
jgi:hypothetical protein